MPFTLTMPKLSPTMEEGTIDKWHKKTGDLANAGDLLAEIGTDKASVEFNALDEGYLQKILVPEGSSAKVGDPIAIFTAEKDESIDGYSPEGIPTAATPQKSAPKEESKVEEKPASEPTAPGSGPGLAQPAFAPYPPLVEDVPVGTPKKKKASPLAKRLAKDAHIDIDNVRGSGPGGRVVSEDLIGAGTEGLVHFYSKKKPDEKAGSYALEKLTAMRRAIGSRLQASKTFIPHFYVSKVIDVSNLTNLRTQLKNLGVKLSLNDFIVKATAYALEKHPDINSGYDTTKEAIIRFQTIGICVAVEIENGLITPIIQQANYKRIDEISSEVKKLAKRAREGALKPEEFQGGSFTISNLGMYGVSQFGAIINPPQAAILAVSGLSEGCGCSGHKKQEITFTLSADHRVIDGSEGAKFLNTLKTLLENPAGLII